MVSIWHDIRERYYREFGSMPGEDPEPDDDEDTEDEEEDANQ
jgi:hypothetical protein